MLPSRSPVDTLDGSTSSLPGSAWIPSLISITVTKLGNGLMTSKPGPGDFTEQSASNASSSRRSTEAAFVFVLAIWLVVSASSIFYVAVFGPNFPFQDDHRWVGAYSGQDSTSLAWYFQSHAGHRIPVVRTITIVIARLSNFDSRYLFLLTAGCLSAGALILILASRRARGRSSVLDIVFPLYGASILHYWNLLQGLQLFLGLYFLLSSLIIGGVLLQFWKSKVGIAVVGISVALHSLNGAVGMAVSIVLIPYLFVVAFLVFRSGDETSRSRAIRIMMPAVFGAVVSGSYVVSMGDVGGADRRIAEILSAMFSALHRAWGHLGEDATSPTRASSVGWISLLLLAGGACGLLNLRRSSSSRAVSASLLALLGSVLVVALAIALGRSSSKHAGGAIWYSTVMAPMPCLIYLLADRAGDGPRRGLGVVLLVLAVLTIDATWPGAWAIGRTRQWAWIGMVEDLQAGVDFDRVSSRYEKAFLPWRGKNGLDMARTLQVMQVRGQGPFAPDTSSWFGISEGRMSEFLLKEERDLLTPPGANRKIKGPGKGRVTRLNRGAILTVREEKDAFRLPYVRSSIPSRHVLECEFFSPHPTEARVRFPGSPDQTAAVRPGFNRVEFVLEKDVEVAGLEFTPGCIPGNYRLSSMVLRRVR